MSLKFANVKASGIEPVVEIPVELLGDTIKVRLISTGKVRRIYPDPEETVERQAQMLAAVFLDDDGETLMSYDMALQIAECARVVDPFKDMSEEHFDALSEEKKSEMLSAAEVEANEAAANADDAVPLSRTACKAIIRAIGSALRGEGTPTGKY